MARYDSRLVSVFSNIGHLFTHMFTILYATAVLHLPGVFGLPFGEMLALSSVVGPSGAGGSKPGAVSSQVRVYEP